MRKYIFATVLICLNMLAFAQMDIPSNGFNPRATISEEVGITSITIKYSRPGVKGREGKIWGGIVGNGFGAFNFSTGTLSSPWRAGANEATKITFEHDVKVEGKDLKAGTYALFMAVEKEKVTIIFSKQTEAWGSFYYTEQDDALRVEVKPVKLEKNVEWLKYEFTGFTENSCTIALQWEKLSIPFKIEMDVENLVLARIREEFKGVKGFISANKLQASMYCFEKNINMDEALVWAQSAVTGKPFGQSGFSAYTNLADGYNKINRTQDADKVMDEGLAIADISQYISHGKSLIKQKRLERALTVMEGAQDKFGNVYAVNNGMALVYSAKGDYSKALKFANKALSQAPNDYMKGAVTKNIEKLKDKKDIN